MCIIVRTIITTPDFNSPDSGNPCPNLIALHENTHAGKWHRKVEVEIEDHHCVDILFFIMLKIIDR